MTTRNAAREAQRAQARKRFEERRARYNGIRRKYALKQRKEEFEQAAIISRVRQQIAAAAAAAKVSKPAAAPFTQ